MPELISKITRKAIKTHTCDYCHCEIPRGESYNVYTLKFDDVYRWKSHIRCTEIAQELEWSGYVELDSSGFQAEDFQEAVRELHDEFISNDASIIASMEDMTKELHDRFAEFRLKPHKPNGYIVGYVLEGRQ